MNILSLAIQNTYDAVEIALFSNDQCVARLHEPKINASKLLIPMISSLLSGEKKEIKDLSYIAVNQGPGPFTTLRVVIATVNGLSFATGLPLIGIDGIKALIEQYKSSSIPITIALLDAFNKDIYYAIKEHDHIISGYAPLESLREILAPYKHKNVALIGNAVPLYKEELESLFAAEITYKPEALVCSIEQIGVLGWHYWCVQENLSKQLFPLYLKQQFYKNQQGQMKAI